MGEDGPHLVHLLRRHVGGEADVPFDDKVPSSDSLALGSDPHAMTFNYRLLARLDQAGGRIEGDSPAIESDDVSRRSADVFLERVDKIDVLVQDETTSVKAGKALVMHLLDDEDHVLEHAGLPLVASCGEDDPRSALPSGFDVDLHLRNLGSAIEQASRNAESVFATLEELLQSELERVYPLGWDGLLGGRRRCGLWSEGGSFRRRRGA